MDCSRCQACYSHDLKFRESLSEGNYQKWNESFYDSVSYLQRAMWSGKFPCSLTRSLSLASKGKPVTKEVVEFLKYILTDGQRMVANEGYIELHRSENRCRVFFLDNVKP